MVEPAAEILARYVPRGVSIEGRGDAPPFEPYEVLLRAWLPEDEQYSERKTKILEGLWHLGQIENFPEPAFQSVPESDWEEAWKARYQPLLVGDRLIVLPTWSEQQPEGRLPVYLEPGMAFGTGTHPTTRDCLGLLESMLTKGSSVLDLGSGSGILAIAAARLGAAKVVAVESDAQAVRWCHQNLLWNDMLGQVRLINRSAVELALTASDTYDMVLANIRTSTILDLLEAGATDWVRPGGHFVFSGILKEQAQSVITGFELRGLELVDHRASEDWRTLAARRPPD